MFAFTIILSFTIFDRVQRLREEKMDKETLQASDYTVQVFNLPKDITEQDLEDWLEECHG